MPSLSDRPEIVGFFSYSRDDDDGTKGALSALRDAIQRELSAQLGRSKAEFRLWQDAEAIAPGKLWESEITTAIEQSVFFIPIVTPRVVRSKYCKFEFDAFLARETTLGRADLVFPILYMTVSALEDEALWRNDPLLTIIGKRQYLDWRGFRHLDIHTPKVRETIEHFCSKIVSALDAPLSTANEQERTRRDVREAQRQAEIGRQQTIEAERRAEEAHKASEAEARGRQDQEKRLAAERRAREAAVETERRRKAQQTTEAAADRQRRAKEAALEAERSREQEHTVASHAPGPDGLASSRRAFLPRVLRGAALPALLLVLWQIGSMSGAIDPRYLSAPTAIMETWLAAIADGTLVGESLSTVMRFGIGFLIGAGLVLAAYGLAALSPRIRPLLDPPFRFFYAIPATAFIPIAMLSFGITTISGVAVTAIAAFCPLWFAAGAKRRSDSRFATIPGAQDAVSDTGRRLPLAAVFAFSAALASEMYASQIGLGRAIADSYSGITDARWLFSVVLTVCILAVAINVLANWIGGLVVGGAHGRGMADRSASSLRRSESDRGGSRWYRAAETMAVPVLLIIVWQIATGLNVASDIVLPAPIDVMREWFRLLGSGELVTHTIGTVWKLMGGILVGLAPALLLAHFMQARPRICAYVLPLVKMLGTIPAIVWLPLAVLWFGIGSVSAVFAIAIGAFLLVLIRLTAGSGKASSSDIGPSPETGAASDVLAGAIVGIKAAFMVLIVAEFMSSESSGLGFLMIAAAQTFNTAQLFAAILTIGFIGLALEVIVTLIMTRVFGAGSGESAPSR